MDSGHVEFVLSDGSRHRAELRRSARCRRLGLRLRDDGSLVLSAPSRTPLHVIEDALPHFVPWLEKRLASRRNATHSHTLPDSLELLFTGQTYRIVRGGDFTEGRPLAAQATSCLRLQDASSAQRLLLLECGDELCLFASPAVWQDCPPNGEGRMVATALQRFCRARASACLPPFLLQTAQQHGLDVNDVRIHDQHSRWASCARMRTGGYRVNLNWRGIFLPPDLFAHLCCHELCHTMHMNHSPAFHAALEAISPNGRQKERALNAAWRALPWWSRLRLAKQAD